MSHHPKISVITSAYNDQKHISESIESILSQTEGNFEFIIIDDGSTDNSLEIIYKFKKRDSRIKLIRNKTNIGLTKSLNKGLEQSQGKYIARQDANDVSLPQRFESQYMFLENNQDICLCGSSISFIDTNGQIIQKKQKSFLFQTAGIAKMLPKQNCIVHSTIFFRNEGFRYRYKFYYAQDYDLYLNLLSSNKKLVNLKDILVHWRMDSNAISYRNRDKQTHFAKKAREFYSQRIKKQTEAYYQFNPESILSRKSFASTNGIVLEDRLKNHLKHGEFTKARILYNDEYRNLKFANNKFLFWIFTHIPFIYKLYRKLVYKDS
ncbi:glycosyltransferase [Patescibacteria group bacterium]|nr:glycosyltransferase [Patescibacteria group bacterium]MBU1889967.1 glycosyltransferase [Patescibacteria group bacterium]